MRIAQVFVMVNRPYEPTWNQYIKRKWDGLASAEPEIWALLIDKINYSSRKATSKKNCKWKIENIGIDLWTACYFKLDAYIYICVQWLRCTNVNRKFRSPPSFWMAVVSAQ